jgi:phosphatidate cytidylyltransferase
VTPFPYTLLVLLVAAGGGLVVAGGWALLGRRRDATRTTRGRTVLVRAGSYAGLAAVLGAAAWLGTPGIALLALVIGAVGLWEWCDLAGLPIHHRLALQVANLVIVMMVAALGSGAAEWLVGGVVLAGIVWPVVRADPERAMRDLGFAAVGCIVLSGMLAHGIGLVVERGEIGAATFVALAVAAAGSDVGAFVVGRRFGRTPLAPRLSPNKTRAGVVGNFIGAAVGIAPFAPVLVTAFGPALVVALVPIVAVGAVWGDLLESAAKREAGLKDTGRWLPGFGGILDRVDSVLIVLPLAYWALRVVDLAHGR